MALVLIKSKKEFDLLYKKGKSQGGSFFSLRFLQGRADEPIKFGIVISTKISKKAVERNKKRRQIKEILSSAKEGLEKGALVLITLKDAGLVAEYKELEKELLFLLKKSGVRK